MTFYYASTENNKIGYIPTGGIGKNKDKCAYANPVLALLYCINVLPPPYKWKSFKENNNGVIIYKEKYPDEFKDIYSKKSGYMYLGKQVGQQQINNGYASKNPVNITDCIFIDDLYTFLTEYYTPEKLIIEKFEDLNYKQRQIIIDKFVEEYTQKKMWDSKNPYTDFINEKMPWISKIALEKLNEEG